MTDICGLISFRVIKQGEHVGRSDEFSINYAVGYRGLKSGFSSFGSTFYDESRLRGAVSV